ncbi:MAG: M50 family metallopeptidase [Opitutaceae bacterium]|nr:M50 family metallopeptidase [Opitutaceae bacterium]
MASLDTRRLPRQAAGMDQAEVEKCCAALGVAADASLEAIERAYLQRNFALIKGGNEDDRLRLRLTYERLVAHRRAAQMAAEAARPRSSAPLPRTPPPVPAPRDRRGDGFPLFAFDNWAVNVVVPPLLLGLVWAVNASPLGMFLKGFHVWMHEFGHATAAWLAGRRATPLPFGWTPVEPDLSLGVYGGLLLLFALLFIAGWRERKAWPMIVALGLAGLQFHLTWRMPEHRQEFWWGAFGGVGGEFYLSALFMALFYVQLPDKFRWGLCRYGFFLIGATAFLNIWTFWDKVYHGLEEIPFGSLINGEDDAGGDMNKLMDGYGWTRSQIRRTYRQLGTGCWVGLGVVYLVFALRLNTAADWIYGKLRRTDAETDG